MNYLAHLFLARPTADSQFGNLLGDFRRGVDIKEFGQAVQLGLKNHYEVDRFTRQLSNERQNDQFLRYISVTRVSSDKYFQGRCY